MRLATAAFLSLIATGAYAAPVGTAETAIGEVLVGENGMTLYTFANDAEGESACYDQCAANWPPLMAEEGAMGDDRYSVIERSDDTYQWAVDGKPLYFWVNDKAPGDTTGDGARGVWAVARP
jgi:predicted lipoprotein with Yx(FWY)xxD motif